MRTIGLDASHSVRFRCAGCGERTGRSLEWSGRHKNLQCCKCGNLIDLTADENNKVIQRGLQARHRLVNKG